MPAIGIDKVVVKAKMLEHLYSTHQITKPVYEKAIQLLNKEAESCVDLEPQSKNVPHNCP